MTVPAPPRPRRLTDRLGFRMAALLSVALLPVGLIAVSQSSYLMREMQARAEAALMGETLRAALPELRLIRLAEGAARALAATVPALLEQGRPVCDAALRAAVAGSGDYSDASYFTLDGRVACAASDGRRDASAAFADAMRGADRVMLLTGPSAPAAEESALFVAQPVVGGDGAVQGFVTLAIPQGRLVSELSVAALREDFTLVLFDDRGAVLSANRPPDHVLRLLPGDLTFADLAQSDGTAFAADDAAGARRSFAVVRMADGRLFALGSWPAAGPLLPVLTQVPAAVFPALMLAVSLVAAWLAAEHLVGRHIRRLRRAITSFAGGNRAAGPLRMEGAPYEIRETADAFEVMTETVMHDEAELENSIHQKEVLLREVHHRVKNNLQLIASIMNMQMRKTRSAEAKVLMKGLQDRVMSLAMIHKGLYQTTGLTDVHTDELFPDILRQVVGLAAVPGRPVQVDARFDDLRLTPDQAVPLALLLTEALTNAMKYGAADPDDNSAERPWMRVRLEREGSDHALLSLANSARAEGASDHVFDDATGLGSQLIAAFVQQLGGELHTDRTESVFHLRVRFPVSPLSEAEARHAPEA